MASSTELRAGSQLLTKSSWGPGRLTCARSIAARDQPPEEIHDTPEAALPLRTRETEYVSGNLWIVVKDVKTLVVYDVE